MLEPVNVDVIITRNLAASWYKKKPEVDIKCLLPRVKVSNYYSWIW